MKKEPVKERVERLMSVLDTPEKQRDALLSALRLLTEDAIRIAPVTNWGDGNDPLIDIRVPSSKRQAAYDTLMAVDSLLVDEREAAWQKAQEASRKLDGVEGLTVHDLGHITRKCERCNGRGWSKNDNECSDCNGFGYFEVD